MKAETCHSSRHFWGISAEAGPCVGHYFPGTPPHAGGSPGLSLSAGQEMGLAPERGPVPAPLVLTQLALLRVISARSQSVVSIPRWRCGPWGGRGGGQPLPVPPHRAQQCQPIPHSLTSRSQPGILGCANERHFPKHSSAVNYFSAEFCTPPLITAQFGSSTARGWAGLGWAELIPGTSQGTSRAQPGYILGTS